MKYLELYYQNEKKIFFSYISNENVFGYTTRPFYATSDTYFLHNDGLKADYEFLISFLNSKLMKFIFYAKGLEIKRSKSKIENEIPIISYEDLKNQKQKETIKKIRENSKKIITFFNKNSAQVKKYIRENDKLLFGLFDIEESLIDDLINKYYMK